MSIYKSYLTNHKDYSRLQHNVCVSKCTELCLVEYCFVAYEYCIQYHDQQKCMHKCYAMIKAGKILLTRGLAPLSEVFKVCFPDVTYTSAKAKRRLLQLPLAVITISTSINGNAEVYLLEALNGLDYTKLIEFIESKMGTKSHSPFSKEDMKHLLTLAQSHREREVLRHIICKTSQLSATAACKLYGWQKMTNRSAAVEEYLKDANDIREAIENIATTQEHAVLLSLGISDELSPSSEDDTSDDNESRLDDASCSHLKYNPTTSELNTILVESNFNWYDFIMQILESCECNSEEEEKISLQAWKSILHKLCCHIVSIKNH